MNITDDQFDKKLKELLSEITADRLLTIPGIYEILSEHFNNEVLDLIANDTCDPTKEDNNSVQESLRKINNQTWIDPDLPG